MSTTHRTMAAIAAASAGVLLLAGCTTDLDAQGPVSSATAASVSTTSAGDDAWHADAEDVPGDDGPGPAIDAPSLATSIAVWDLDLSFAAANAVNGTESSPETIGNTAAMADDESTLDPRVRIAA
ncbi:hypothetical protein [Demequina zhanjiangensis]|uniref:Uncharacterized protein n=1 Tax=Demequina zhanjiangensis TaxID=3051659 RepID=A0ABT8FZ24_9MICO|nr:hypothetical protein [Demequina sp. SYSU T00b26]MDN4472154.1 hypothetical protein [Demequina sp. SYSU T00b26]